MSENNSGWVRWWFADRRAGRHGLVFGQPPNPPLFVVSAAVGARLLVGLTPARDGALAVGLEAVAAGALGWWAVDEVARGVNPWRRLTGALTLVMVIAAVGWRLRRLA